MGSRRAVPGLLFPLGSQSGRRGEENLSASSSSSPMIPTRRMPCQFCSDFVSLPINNPYGTKKLSRMIKNLCHHMNLNSSDVPDACSGELLPLCEPCKKKMERLWEYQGNLDKIGADIASTVSEIEKSVADAEILRSENAHSSISPTPRGVLPLKKQIFEGYRDKLFFKQRIRIGQPPVRNLTQNLGSSRSSSSASSATSSSSLGIGYRSNSTSKNFNGVFDYRVPESSSETPVAPHGRPLRTRPIALPAPPAAVQKVSANVKKEVMGGRVSVKEDNSRQLGSNKAVVLYQNGASVRNGLQNLNHNQNFRGYQAGTAGNSRGEMSREGAIKNHDEGKKEENRDENGEKMKKLKELDDDDEIVTIEPQKTKLIFKNVEIYKCHGSGGFKYFQCSLCSYKRPFTSDAIGQSRVFTFMKRHIETKHGNAQNFSCVICKKSFINRLSLRKHRQRHPPECDICGRHVKGKFQNLVWHRFTHKNDDERRAALAAKEEGAREAFLSNKQNYEVMNRNKKVTVTLKRRRGRKARNRQKENGNVAAAATAAKIDLRLRKNRHLSKHKVHARRKKVKVISSNQNEYLCYFCKRTFNEERYLKSHVTKSHKDDLPLPKRVSARKEPVFVPGSQDEFCYALGLSRIQNGEERTEVEGEGGSAATEDN
ncbi:unnamed protein product [Orchesella dallaii]|uniref:C2H2-type domain-containing protein n=1 Tax=Orchesella dallaii TaxID=48710 RepID=A0ABP1R6D8_9HEXA